MSQSRFSIVLVGVSALLRRPLVSRLRPAGFTARCSGGFCRSALPSVSEIAAGRVDLRAHGFRFSARTASGLPLGGLALPPSASEIAARRVGLRAHASVFRHAPLRGCRSAGWFFCLPLRGCRWAGWPSGFGFRFSACTDSEWPLGGLVLPPSASEIALGGLAFGLTASAFRPAPIRSGRWASSFFHLPLRRLLLVGLAFGLTASAFRHAPLRSGRWASWFFRLPLRKLPSAGWPSGSLLPLFGMHRSAPPRRRSEDRRSTTTRHLFHFKTLIPTC